MTNVDPSVGPPKTYTPPKSKEEVAAYTEAQNAKILRKAPAHIRKLVEKQRRYNKQQQVVQSLPLGSKARAQAERKLNQIGFTSDMVTTIGAYLTKHQVAPPVVQGQGAIGVAGGRYYDMNTGKFLGYSPDTKFQQYLPKAGSPEAAAGSFLQSPTGMPVQAPRYFDGDEYKPQSDMTADQRGDLQDKMAAAHLYGSSPSYSRGVWKDDDINAYKQALAGANQVGKTVEEYLKDLAAAPFVDDGTGSDNPLDITLARPEDIKQVANATAHEIYGGYLPQSVINQMIESFHQVQIQAQTAQRVTQDFGGNALADPQIDQFVEEQLKQRYPAQVAATSFGDKMQTVIDTFTKPVV